MTGGDRLRKLFDNSLTLLYFRKGKGMPIEKGQLVSDYSYWVREAGEVSREIFPWSFSSGTGLNMI